MKKFRDVLWGVFFIIIGLIIAGNATGITDINIFFEGWWTLFIIIPCFINLFTEEEKNGNIIGLLIGIALFLSCQNILDFELIWKLLFPAILISIGISIIFRDTVSTKINKEIKKVRKTKGDTDEYCATFSKQSLNFDNEEYKGSDLTAIFGGVKCDLTKAVIKSDIVINATAVFGGIDINVPENVKVKIKSTSIFGGVSDNKKHSNNEDDYIVYINATCLFGGVEVK